MLMVGCTLVVIRINPGVYKIDGSNMSTLSDYVQQQEKNKLQVSLSPQG